MAEDLAADARCLGLVLVGFEDDDDSDGIWPDNVPALTAFLRVQTQWCWGFPADGSAHRLGLDYGRVVAGLGSAGIEMTPDLFAELQVIEAGALAPDEVEV